MSTITSFYYRVKPGTKLLIPVRNNDVFPVFNYFDEEIKEHEVDLISIKSRAGHLYDIDARALLGIRKTNSNGINVIKSFSDKLENLSVRANNYFQDLNLDDFAFVGVVKTYWECQILKELSNTICGICKTPAPHIDNKPYICNFCKTMEEI